MAYVITEPCINVKDASCLDVCPVDCIYSTDADNMYFIHPDECIDHGDQQELLQQVVNADSEMDRRSSSAADLFFCARRSRACSRTHWRH